jgi:hypothetical protein
MSDFDFSDGFPSIEVDVEYFNTLSPIERVKYIVSLIFQDSGFSDRLKLMEYVASTLTVVSDTFVKSDDLKEYIRLLHSGTKLMGVSNAIGNFVRAKQNTRNKKNDAIAKMMGFANGQFIDEVKIDANAAMIDSFLLMTDSQLKKFGITVDNLNDTAKDDGGKSKDNSDADESSVKKVTMVGTIDIDGTDIKWGMKINSIGNSDEGATNNSTCILYYPIHKLEGITSEELKQEFSEIMTRVFIEKVNKSQNFIKIKGRQFDISPRKEISAKIRNIDVDNLVISMRNTLSNDRRRGIMFAGEPGVGKTIAVHKIINMFRDNLVFWVSPESLQTTKSIRDTFKTFKLFKNSIIVFDDIDSANLTSKDEITNVFLEELDGTSDLTGFIIGVVNDPSLIHPALIGRPERFDEAIEVKKPSTEIEITEILRNKANDNKYKTWDELDNLIDINDSIAEYIVTTNDKINKLKEVEVDSLSYSDSLFIEEYGNLDEDELKKKTLIDILNDNNYKLYDIDEDSDEYSNFIRTILSIPPEDASSEEVDTYVKKQLTQVMVASLIAHCETYSREPIITISDLWNAYNKRLESMKVSSLVATRGRLKEDSNNMSDEAKANLARHR